jgi:hypothetical protein
MIITTPMVPSPIVCYVIRQGTVVLGAYQEAGLMTRVEQGFRMRYYAFYACLKF